MSGPASIQRIPVHTNVLFAATRLRLADNGVRHGFLGVSEVDPLWSLAVLSGLTAAIVALDVALFRRGYGLTD